MRRKTVTRTRSISVGASQSGTFGPGKDRVCVIIATGQNAAFMWSIGDKATGSYGVFQSASAQPVVLTEHDMGDALDSEISVFGSTANQVITMIETCLMK